MRDLTECGTICIYHGLLIQKFTVLWLLSLFVWNVALAGVPSLLLCLHHDFELHVESEDRAHGCCKDEHAEPEEPAHCVVEGDCTDLELSGGELIPARLNEVHAVELPTPALAGFCYGGSAQRKVEAASSLLPPLRGPPPSVHWLTDLYIQKTVFRV